MDLTRLIETYRGPLIGLIASWGVPWGDATEIAQESFATAWLNRAACRGDWTDPDIVGRWLRGVARNRYRTWARGRGRWRARFVAFDPATLEAAVAPETSDSEPSDLVDQVRHAIARLPAPQRQVVLMHYLEATSVVEVAALLSITPKAVEGRLYQARRTLRRLLGDVRPTMKIGGLLLCL